MMDHLGDSLDWLEAIECSIRACSGEGRNFTAQKMGNEVDVCE